jgi:hypothetical protein
MLMSACAVIISVTFVDTEVEGAVHALSVLGLTDAMGVPASTLFRSSENAKVLAAVGGGGGQGGVLHGGPPGARYQAVAEVFTLLEQIFCIGFSSMTPAMFQNRKS